MERCQEANVATILQFEYVVPGGCDERASDKLLCRPECPAPEGQGGGAVGLLRFGYQAFRRRETASREFTPAGYKSVADSSRIPSRLSLATSIRRAE